MWVVGRGGDANSRGLRHRGVRACRGASRTLLNFQRAGTRRVAWSDSIVLEGPSNVRIRYREFAWYTLVPRRLNADREILISQVNPTPPALRVWPRRPLPEHRIDQSGKHFHGGGLPGSIRAQVAGDLAGARYKADIVHYRDS